jgi:hypothetical protein
MLPDSDMSINNDNMIEVRLHNIQVIMNIHNKGMEQIWKWGEDTSNVPSIVYGRCIGKIEQLLETGSTNTVAIAAGAKFKWGIHWHRCIGILHVAINALKENKSITLAIKTIRACIMSYIKEESENYVIDIQSNPHDSFNLPFSKPLRHFVAEYIQISTDLIRVVSTVVLNLKMELNNIVENGILSDINPIDSSSNNKTTTDGLVIYNGMYLSIELQNAINDMMLLGSRDGYKVQLETCFDFLHFFVRCSVNSCISFEVVNSIWNNVLLRSYTASERDLVISFVSRLILLKNSFVSSNATTGTNMETNDDSMTNEYKSSDAPSSSSTIEFTPRRNCYCPSDAILGIFKLLLCDSNFIKSSYFSASGYACLEKYYRRLCSDNGYIFELQV